MRRKGDTLDSSQREVMIRAWTQDSELSRAEVREQISINSYQSMDSRLIKPLNVTAYFLNLFKTLSFSKGH